MKHASRILLLHGAEGAGVRSVDLAGLKLENLGHAVVDVQLQNTRFWQGRNLDIRNENLNRIHAVAQPGDHVVAHSNGSRLAWDMLDGGFRFGHLFLFAPALPADASFRDCCYAYCDVFANPHDKALLAAGMLPGKRNPWGAMGRVGYKGRCRGKVRTLVYPERRGLGHSHYFEEPLLSQVVRVIDLELRMNDGGGMMNNGGNGKSAIIHHSSDIRLEATHG